MSAALPRLLLKLATGSLGAYDKAWGDAMVAEFVVAERDGQAFRFALGCLIGAWRMLPHHGEGRLALAGHALACGLFLPMAALFAVAARIGVPFVEASDDMLGLVSGSGSHRSLLNAGSLAIGPALTLAMLLLAASHLPLAWWVAERDWRRVATALRILVSAMMTLALAMVCVGLPLAGLLWPGAALAIELAALGTLARRHAAQGGRDAGERLGAIL
ncbi:hypothetical protein [Sphingomonas sp. R1]|uniref:hypothetical protein n=1 Tax=Sphingomonas sp. R1 TaxID=399176 RepID=UPI0022240B13|nr:hypothetical protein [Sphingomonas sp. R1]UYY77067.1 hypothetical protein OIM94_16450 [Sphingomonas sp. R1]